jgi:hypothetical protein
MDIKYFKPYLILWVANNSGSVANLYFTEGEDKFQARPFTNSLSEHEGDLKGDGDDTILTDKAIFFLNTDNMKVS